MTISDFWQVTIYDSRPDQAGLPWPDIQTGLSWAGPGGLGWAGWPGGLVGLQLGWASKAAGLAGWASQVARQAGLGWPS